MMKKKIAALAGMVMVAGLALTGCATVNTSSALCGWVQGDGTYDSKVHKVLLPGEDVRPDNNEVVKYVPCNSRNYIISDGSQKGVDGAVTGDSSTPVVAYTKDKTQVSISLSAYWTLNEGKDAFNDFIALCLKYNCAQQAGDQDVSESNFGTKGWNGMLAENFYPSIRAAVQNVTPNFDNSMWENGGNADERTSFANAVSAEFMKQIAQTTGYSTDLFCGSGNSRFTDSSKTNFTCTDVRFRIDNVAAKDANVQKNLNTQSQSDQIIATNKARLEQAKALYGDQASYWLGLRDAAASCKATCQFLVREPSN